MIKATLLIAFTMMLMSACTHSLRDQCSQWTPIIHMNAALRESKVLKLSREQQYEVYFCAMRFMHPPHLGIAITVASNGEKIIPLLRHRLKKSDEREIVDILFVFEQMEANEFFSVSTNETLMDELNLGRSRIGNKVLKSIADDSMRRIRGLD
ncbi:MAG: hypothetical protein COR54_09445 [Elusimicrobia bacterium CG22_combo_CG10-13_8_21_14_all_63_91]|nr:MAG: hypothetical protein COR54_09445 [Elusimicrobia bacterium CG22_combo_CG10-13_8_21_14_all_63_91]